jgi:hypothetical protein
MKFPYNNERNAASLKYKTQKLSLQSSLTVTITIVVLFNAIKDVLMKYGIMPYYFFYY